jgi:Ca2+:H+ antiporter
VSQAQASFNLRRFLLSGEGWPYVLVPFIPIAIALRFADATPRWCSSRRRSA